MKQLSVNSDDKSMAVKYRFLALIVAAIAMLCVIAWPALAQDVTVPMPGEYFAPGSPSTLPQPPDPMALLQDDGSSFSIPIPGGGEILVHGPQSEAPTSIAPIENWATRRNTPFSIGGGPMGPIAPSH